MLNESLIKPIILLAGLFHWFNIIEIMLNVSLNQYTITIILLAGLLDWVT